MSDQSELQRDLGRVEGKLDSVIEMLKANDTKHAAADIKYSGLEVRVRKMEGRLLYFTGAGVGIALFLTKVDFTKLLSVAHAAVGAGG